MKSNELNSADYETNSTEKIYLAIGDVRDS